jgi:tRNA threonylcarbamoyladenosine biosynthesis protein TsaB
LATDFHGSTQVNHKTEMLLLVTDTSGKHGFVALARAGEGAKSNEVAVVEEVPLVGGTFSAQLVPQIAALLAKHKLRKTDIGAFIVVSGPGSFTGLRVGLAAIKALAEILRKPIVPVSLLEVVAHSAVLVAAGSGQSPKPVTFRYAVALDAGRGEAFVGQYEIVITGKTGGPLKCAGESLLGLEEVATLMESRAAQWIVTPDAAVSDFLSARPAARFHVFKRANRPDSADVARVGWRKLQAGETVTPEQLEANYIRRSDAEILAAKC